MVLLFFMKYPNIIIPACNEERSLQTTLKALPRDCNPVVAVNGSSDDTDKVARSFGAETYVYERAGKDDAFRETLRKMGNRALDEPFLITDADTVPFMPKSWIESMLRLIAEEVDDDRPVAVSGLLGYRPNWSKIPTNLPTVLRTARLYKTQRQLSDRGLYLPSGANAGFKLNKETLDTLVESDERYWPGEDQYYFDLVQNMGGIACQNKDPRSLVFSSSRYHIPLTTLLLKGRRATHRLAVQDHNQRGKIQDGTIPYESENPSWEMLAK